MKIISVNVTYEEFFCYRLCNQILKQVKFMFSKKATKIDEIFTVDLTVTTYCQIDDLSLWPSPKT